MKLINTAAMAGLLIVSLAACKRDEAPETAPSDPASAVEALADALRENDLVRFNQLSLPEDLQQQTREHWESQRTEPSPIDPEEDARFREMMARLTAPDAEAQIYTDIEPMLNQYETEFKAQLPLMVAMGSAFANQAIQANETLSAEQKQHASEVLGAFAGWVGTAPIGDHDKAREAIAVVTGTARRTDVESMDDFRRMEQDEMLRRASIVWEGGKDFFAVYGFDIDQSLASVSAEVASQTGDTASVRVNYRLLGSDLSFDMPMERIDGGWYSRDLVQSARDELEGRDEVLDEPAEYEDEEIVEEDDLEDGY